MEVQRALKKGQCSSPLSTYVCVLHVCFCPSVKQLFLIKKRGLYFFFIKNVSFSHHSFIMVIHFLIRYAGLHHTVKRLHRSLALYGHCIPCKIPVKRGDRERRVVREK